MDLSRVRSPPIAFSNHVLKIQAEKELGDLRPYLSGRILEVFCRDGLLGKELLASDIDWSGIDPEASMLENAFLQGVFSVSCAVFPPAQSYDVIFGAFAPFSYLSTEGLKEFATAVFEALCEGGMGLFELWETPSAMVSQAFMDTYDGSSKIVRACVPVVEKNTVVLDIEWMVAKPKQSPMFMHHREERYLHTRSAIEECFSWGISYHLTINDRLWICVEKPKLK